MHNIDVGSCNQLPEIVIACHSLACNAECMVQMVRIDVAYGKEAGVFVGKVTQPHAADTDDPLC